MLVAKLQTRLSEHHRYIRHEGQDLDEIRGWRWSTPSDGGRHAAAPSSYAAPMRHARR